MIHAIISSRQAAADSHDTHAPNAMARTTGKQQAPWWNVALVDTLGADNEGLVRDHNISMPSKQYLTQAFWWGWKQARSCLLLFVHLQTESTVNTLNNPFTNGNFDKVYSENEPMCGMYN